MPEAMRNLATMYRKGEAPEQDDKAADALMQAADSLEAKSHDEDCGHCGGKEEGGSCGSCENHDHDHHHHHHHHDQEHNGNCGNCENCENKDCKK